MKRVNDIYTDWVNNGVFHNLYNRFNDFPWNENDLFSANRLDIGYHGWHSGNKFASPLLDKVGNELTFEDITDFVIMSCMDSWKRIYNTYYIEYSPIENVDEYTTITHEGNNTDNINETNNIKHGESIQTQGNITYGKQVNVANSLTHGMKVNSTSENSGSDKNNIYGFNSSSSVPSGETNNIDNSIESITNSGTDNGTNTEKQSGNDTSQSTETHSGNDENIKTATNTNNNKYTDEKRRHGNIGVTTNQQMLTAERELFAKKFINYMYEDLDRLLTLSVY